MDSRPTTDRRVIWRIIVVMVAAFVVLAVAVLVGLVRHVQHQRAVIERLSAFSLCSVFASYEPYRRDRGGDAPWGYWIHGQRPFWADWLGRIVDGDPFAEIQEVWMAVQPGQEFLDSDMSVFQELPGLRRLVLTSTGITDDGAALLAKNTKLVDLYLKGTAISDRTLLILDKLPELRELDVTQTKVTKKAVDEFRKRHPDCLVFD